MKLFVMSSWVLRIDVKTVFESRNFQCLPQFSLHPRSVWFSIHLFKSCYRRYIFSLVVNADPQINTGRGGGVSTHPHHNSVCLRLDTQAFSGAKLFSYAVNICTNCTRRSSECWGNLYFRCQARQFLG